MGGFLCISSAYSIYTIPNPHFLCHCTFILPQAPSTKQLTDATHGRAVTQESNPCGGTMQFKHKCSIGAEYMYFDMDSDLIVRVMGCVCASFYDSCCPLFYFPDISVRNMGDRDVVVLQCVLIASNQLVF